MRRCRCRAARVGDDGGDVAAQVEPAVHLGLDVVVEGPAGAVRGGAERGHPLAAGSAAATPRAVRYGSTSSSNAARIAPNVSAVPTTVGSVTLSPWLNVARAATGGPQPQVATAEPR